MLRKRLSKNGNLFLINPYVVTLVDPVFIFKEHPLGKLKRVTEDISEYACKGSGENKGVRQQIVVHIKYFLLTMLIYRFHLLCGQPSMMSASVWME